MNNHALRMALDVLPKAVAVLRVSDWVVLYANALCERMYASAAGPQGIVGRPFTASQTTTGAENFQSVILRQLALGAPHAEYESERVRTDGARVHVQVTVTAMDDPDEGPLWVATIEDITARRRAEQELSLANQRLERALLGSERRFERIVGSGMFGLFYGALPTSEAPVLRAANDAFAAMTGWSHADIAAGALGSVGTLFDPCSGVFGPRHVQELRDKGFSAILETELLRRDKSRLPVLVGVALTDTNEHVTIVMDRSEYKDKEAALRASQARFDAISNVGVIGVVVVSTPNTVVEVNDACARMLGYSREEYLTRQVTFDQLTPPAWTEVTLLARRQLKERGFTDPFRKHLRHKDGRMVPVLIAGVAVDDQQTLGLIIDLTEQQRAEDALRATEAQLRQAQKMEAVGRLAGGVAHDFNNVLSVILSYAELIRSDLGAQDPLHSDLEEIQRAARRAASLTRQLLLFSRRQVAQAKVIDLNEALASANNMLQRLVGEDVQILFVADPLAGRVRVDPAHLEQVVMNLVVNARDAMPFGGSIRIDTRCGAAGEDGQPRTAVFSVADTGSGMDDCTRARLFEPFFTTKEHGKGTGLGLSTVLGIVEQAGGTIAVASELGRGTTFTITLPRIDGASETRGSEPPPAKHSSAGAETILLIEDEEQVRRVSRTILEAVGYRVVDVDDPLRAIELFDAYGGSIDMVLTDLVMLHMNGVELIRQLRSRRANLPVLCMSGYTDDETARHGLQSLKIPFLQKPFTPDLLRKRVREVLETAAAGSACA